MKTVQILLPLFIAVPAAIAAPFTVRQLPAGFDAPARGGAGGPRIMNPIAANFLGNGRLQWYQGGNVISRFPEGGTITLPAITLPQTPSATVVPLTAAACDVDRDGDIDLLRINEWNGNAFKYTLQVFLNNGSGTFSLGYRVDWNNSLPYDEGGHYLTILPADYNKNGTVDLAILETYSSPNTGTNPDHWDGKLYIRWNDGSGGFPTTSNLQADGLSTFCDITTADYDHDGDADIHCSEYTTYGPDKVLSLPDEHTRSLLFSNNGDGAFTVGSNFPVQMPRVMLDINNDGWADLADGLHKALNNGDGTFGPVTDQDSWWNYAYIFADYDSDGTSEMVVIDDAAIKWANNTLATLPANVDGLGAADSDGDGDVDFFASMANGTFAFIENRELHTAPGATLTGSRNIGGVSGMCSADFDLNGRDDLVVAAAGQEKLYFIYTQQDGLPGQPSFRFTHSEATEHAVAADFDADGRPDVAYTLPADGTVRLAYNTVDAPLQWPEATIATGLQGVSYLACGNIGLPSGRPDLFTYAGSTGQLHGLNQTGGTWSSFNILSPSGPAPQGIAAGQHTAGPGDELAYIGGGNGSRFLSGAQLSFGWAPLSDSPQVEVDNNGASNPYRLVWADATGDDSKEVVYINGTGGLSAWNPSALTSTVLIPGPAGIRDIAAVDWDCDGRTDILAATANGLTLFHYMRSRHQWFRSELHKPEIPEGYNLVSVLDINRDGRPDAAAYNFYGRIDFLRNVPNNLRTDLFSQPAEVNITAGTAASVLTLSLTNVGRPVESGGLADLNVAVTQCELIFQQAISGPGGTWTPGAVIGGNALTFLVAGVSLQANGVTIASKSGSGASGDGRLWLDYPSGGPVVPISPSDVVDHTLRISIPANAQQQTTTRFFVTVNEVMGNVIGVNQLTPGYGKPTLLMNNHPVLVTIVPNYTPLQQWRVNHFGAPDGTGQYANDADYDNDGVTNLTEYVAGTNPEKAETGLYASNTLTLGPVTSPQAPVTFNLVMSNAALTDSHLRVTVLQSSDLKTWSTQASHTGGGAWTGTQPLLGVGSTHTTHIFTPGYTTQSKPRLYLRLKAEELP
jgi:hypothetical protein